MIYQKNPGPTKVLFARISADTYAFICHLAGEDSLPRFLEKTFGGKRESASKICNFRNPKPTIGAEYHVR